MPYRMNRGFGALGLGDCANPCGAIPATTLPSDPSYQASINAQSQALQDMKNCLDSQGLSNAYIPNSVYYSNPVGNAPAQRYLPPGCTEPPTLPPPGSTPAATAAAIAKYNPTPSLPYTAPYAGMVTSGPSINLTTGQLIPGNVVPTPVISSAVPPGINATVSSAVPPGASPSAASGPASSDLVIGGFDLSTIPWYLWAGGAAVALFALSKK